MFYILTVKKNILLSILLVPLLFGCAPAIQIQGTNNLPDLLTQENISQTQQKNAQSLQSTQIQQPSPPTQPTPPAQPAPSITITPPLPDAASRITKKPFGIYVSPQNSPVQPEHFTGYHTGTDFEIFQGELNKDVSVSAICTGKIDVKRTAQGYGGVLVESCNLDNQPVTVVYGHLKLSSISPSVSDTLTAGESFALLGDAYSAETGGERKHLHLGIRKGTAVNLLGYVQKQTDLAGWLDYQQLL